MNAIGYKYADWIKGMEWSHTATLSPHKYRLNEHNSFNLCQRLHRHKYINKVFYVMETDRTKFNHLHLLLDTTFMDRDMTELRYKLNTILGYKEDSGVMQYVDKIRSTTGVCNYVMKHMKYNEVYNILV